MLFNFEQGGVMSSEIGLGAKKAISPLDAMTKAIARDTFRVLPTSTALTGDGT